MARPSAVALVNGQYQYTLQTLLRRINVKLASLIPYRRMEFRPHDKQYYIMATDPTNPAVHMSTMGPYYTNYWIALADYLDIWDLHERPYDPKVLVCKGIVRKNAPLPSILQFDVVPQTLHDMVAAWRRLGWTIIPPPAAQPKEAVLYHYHKGKRYNSATGLEAPSSQEERDESARLHATAPEPVTAEVTPDRPLWSVPDEEDAGN